MKILVIGGGGREHALVWKFAQSPRVAKIFAAPGNAGTASMAENVAIDAEDVDALLEFAVKEAIDLTVVGPEAPLVLGIVDMFKQKGLRVFGPSKEAAQLEGSKSYSKQAMDRFGVATAAYGEFTDAAAAKEYIRSKGVPIVVKADGLAAGKGVIVAHKLSEALAAVDQIMEAREFGAAGDLLVVEEFLEGEEASFLAFCDGKTVVPMDSSQDHKPIFDGDKGPNTGGMGAYSPAPVVTDELYERAMSEVMVPMVEGMAREGNPYVGILYAGLMIKDNRITVLEFNCRFGDPECQPILMRLKSDLVDVLEAGVDGKLDTIELSWDERATVCIVMASEGYPGSYPKGVEILGLEEAAKLDDVFVFHAGTKMNDGKVVTSGGRVLGVTALGDGVEDAINRSYEAVKKICWPGVQFRTDIGKKALNR
jgi:phosphoribosylamine--glycine ligase